MSKVRALLVDDHTLVRQGIRRILESDEDIAVEAEAQDGRTAVQLVSELAPHVVVMDVALPELSGVEATRRIVKQNKSTGVLILTMHSEEFYVRESLRAGARGYVLKDADAAEVVRGVKAVSQGESYFSPAVSGVMLNQYVSGSADLSDADIKLALLTTREREVLQLIAEGKRSKEVASSMAVSVHSVDSHRKHIMEKLDLHNTAQLVRFALQARLVH
jgi:DNA-binding NarL/FixJ family response regulator